MRKGSLIKNKMFEKYRSHWNELFQKLSTLSFERKRILQYCILFKRNDWRTVSTNFERLFLYSRIKDILRCSLRRPCSYMILTMRILRFAYFESLRWYNQYLNTCGTFCLPNGNVAFLILTETRKLSKST